MASQYRFVPMATILREIAKDRGHHKIGGGRRRRITVADLMNMSDEQRTRLANRLLKGGK